MKNKMPAFGLSVPFSIGSFGLLVAFSFAVGFASPRAAHAQTPCYSYSPISGATVPVSFAPQSNIRQTLALPNQNPPSILQEMDFTAANENCALWYQSYGVSKIAANFIAGGATLPFAGSPFPFQPDSNWILYDGSWVEPLDEMEYYGLSDIGSDETQGEINNENAIIGNIDALHQFTVQIGGTINVNGSPYGYATMSAPATNCVYLGGTGPRKVVFARGKSWSSTAADMLYQSENVITNGYKAIDPYKTYQNQFSFYMDLRNYNDSLLMSGVSSDAFAFNPQVASQSSCAGAIGKADQYIFFFNSPAAHAAFSFLDQGVSFYNFSDDFEVTNEYRPYAPGADTDNVRAAAIIHETGHASAGLLDEYLYNQGSAVVGNSGSLVDKVNTASLGSVPTTENCTSNPSRDYRGPDGHLYGGYLNIGCGYLFENIQPGQKRPAQYYRPATSSIMNGPPNWNLKFDVVSCGYIIAAIDGQALTQPNAASHWPQCLTLDTAGKTEIPPVMPPPTVKSITPVSPILEIVPRSWLADFFEIKTAHAQVMPNAFSVSGTGFTPTGNSVKLTPVGGNGSTYYEVDDIPSGNGTSFIFTVATTTPDGTYNVAISALNSTWTTTPYTVTVSGNGSGDTSTIVGGTSGTYTGGSSGTGTSSVTATWPSTTSPASSPATLKYSCPSGYVLVGTVCNGGLGLPSVVATGSYSCPSGYSVSGSSCYLCPNGYTLSGTICNINTTPAGLTAKTNGQGRIDLSWNNGGVPNAAAINIERAIGTLGAFTVIGGTRLTVSGSVPLLTSYSDTGLLPSQAYQYRVNLLLSHPDTGIYSTGPYSSIIKVTSLTPSKPVLTVSTSSTSGITLAWTDSDTGITSFNIFPSPKTNVVASVASSTKSYKVTGLLPSTKYCYFVDAVINPVNDASSTVVCATTQKAPPTVLTANGMSCIYSIQGGNKNDAFTFSGSPQGGTAPYSYGLVGIPGFDSGVSIPATSIPGSYGQDLFYNLPLGAASLQTTSKDGQTTHTACVNTATISALISNVSSSALTASGATVSWTTTTPTDGQVFYGLTTSYGNNTMLNTALSTSHRQTLVGLAPGTIYHYQVKSHDMYGNLASSGDLIFTTSSALKSSASYRSSASYTSSSSYTSSIASSTKTADVWDAIIDWFKNLFR